MGQEWKLQFAPQAIWEFKTEKLAQFAIAIAKCYFEI